MKTYIIDQLSHIIISIFRNEVMHMTVNERLEICRLSYEISKKKKFSKNIGLTDITTMGNKTKKNIRKDEKKSLH